MVAIKAILLVDSKIARARIRDFEKINPKLKIAPGWQITDEHRSGSPTKSWIVGDLRPMLINSLFPVSDRLNLW